MTNVLRPNNTVSIPGGNVNQGPITFANDRPFVLIGGVNVIESEPFLMEVAAQFDQVCGELGISWVFKASFDKANRSSVRSFRGPGLDKGLQALAAVKARFDVPICTDVHEPGQAAAVAEVADIVQLPAFLCRQTDLVVALAKTGKVINIKKAQFLAPLEMRHIITKCLESGNPNLLLCERGSCFGYNNLVVDMLGFGIMKQLGAPLVFDVTHALQMPGGRADSADGRRSQVLELAKAGLSQGIAGLFLETHPDPDQAKCDGPCALRLSQLTPFLSQLQQLDQLIKSQPCLETR